MPRTTSKRILVSAVIPVCVVLAVYLIVRVAIWSFPEVTDEQTDSVRAFGALLSTFLTGG